MTEKPDTDLGEEIGEPIVVPDSAFKQIIWLLVRYALVALAGSSLVNGVLGEDAIALLTSDNTVKWVVGGVVSIGLAAYGALKTHKNVTVQGALSDKLPNHIARRLSEPPAS